MWDSKYFSSLLIQCTVEQRTVDKSLTISLLGFAQGHLVWQCSLVITHSLFWRQLERKRRKEILKGQVQTRAPCCLLASFGLQVLIFVKILKESFCTLTLHSDMPQSLIQSYPKGIFIFPSVFVSTFFRLNKQFKHFLADTKT